MRERVVDALEVVQVGQREGQRYPGVRRTRDQGGQFLVDSRPGVGSEFTLELPRNITARPGLPPRT